MLPLDMQRNFKFMIHISQNAQFLSAGSSKIDISLFVVVFDENYPNIKSCNILITFSMPIFLIIDNAENLQFRHGTPYNELNQGKIYSSL